MYRFIYEPSRANVRKRENSRRFFAQFRLTYQESISINIYRMGDSNKLGIYSFRIKFVLNGGDFVKLLGETWNKNYVQTH